MQSQLSFGLIYLRLERYNLHLHFCVNPYVNITSLDYLPTHGRNFGEMLQILFTSLISVLHAYMFHIKVLHNN